MLILVTPDGTVKLPYVPVLKAGFVPAVDVSDSVLVVVVKPAEIFTALS